MFLTIVLFLFLADSTFALDPATGDLWLHRTLDREQMAFYSLLVQVIQ
jgi:hypothetical protein